MAFILHFRVLGIFMLTIKAGTGSLEIESTLPPNKCMRRFAAKITAFFNCHRGLATVNINSAWESHTYAEEVGEYA